MECLLLCSKIKHLNSDKRALVTQLMLRKTSINRTKYFLNKKKLQKKLISNVKEGK